MRFTVFAFSPIPDLETARRNFDLHDLSDKEVAKVLHHQRKQQTGHSEALNWDQMQIASVSLVHFSLDYVEMGTHTLAELDESGLINKLYNALDASGHMVSWGSSRQAIPLLHFRCMKHRISHPSYWAAIKDGQDVHIDLRDAFGPDDTEMPTLDSFVKRFHCPGMLGHSIDSVWQSYLNDDFEGIARHSDYKVLNTYLLALEVMSLRGMMTYQDAARARMKLRDYLENGAEPSERYTPFLEAWENKA